MRGPRLKLASVMARIMAWIDGRFILTFSGDPGRVAPGRLLKNEHSGHRKCGAANSSDLAGVLRT